MILTTAIVPLFFLPLRSIAFSNGPFRLSNGFNEIALATRQDAFLVVNKEEGDDCADLASPSSFTTTKINTTTGTASRRTWLSTAGMAAAVASCSTIMKPSAAKAISPPPRIEGIGGGADMISPPSSAIKAPDVIYPDSMLGPWQCQRLVAFVEGDKDQAKAAWQFLGGCLEDTENLFTKQKAETYLTRYIKTDEGSPNGNVTVADRGYEIASRAHASNVKWDVQTPNVLTYSGVELAVMQRSDELPTDKGFGFNELVRITAAAGASVSAAGGRAGIGLAALPSFGNIQRAVRVQRRYRRAFDDEGNRVVEGLEIVKTYRVLDGVAGVEMPTSTTKTQIRMTRPQTSSQSSTDTK